MSEIERLKAERDEFAQQFSAASEQLQTIRMQSKFESLARQKGCKDPEMAFLAVKSQLVLDDAGNLKGAEEALKRLREQKEYLFSGSQPLGSNGGTKQANVKVSPGQSLLNWVKSH